MIFFSDLYTIILHHLKAILSDYKKHPDLTLASVCLLIKHVIAASKEKNINMSLIESIFSLVKYALQSVIDEIKVSEKVNLQIYPPLLLIHKFLYRTPSFLLSNHYF